MPRLLKFALFCGATPLLIGIAIYVSWRLTRAEWLMLAGLINIGIGLLMFLFGAVCLLLRSARIQTGGTDGRHKLSLSRKFAWALLITNFPAALFITLSAIDVETRYTVTVINESNRPIQSFLLIGPGVRAEVGSISPNRRTRKHLHFSGDGSLGFEIRLEQSKTNGVVEGYVTGGLGGAKNVRVKADGSIEVEQMSR